MSEQKIESLLKEYKKVVVSVAWPYANGNLHLGHLAGSLLAPNILNDFLRLAGSDVIMVSGSDMHGTPIAVKAWKEGVEPADFAAKQHEKDLDVLRSLGANYSLYTSTANKIHERVVQKIFSELVEAGFIFKDTIEQFWSEKEHKFLLDRYIEGECPHCGTKGARGDQCDACGKTLTPDELIEPYSVFGDETLEKRKSTNYFLDLKKLQPFLEKFYKLHENYENWRVPVKSVTEAWLKEGLEPRAITRDMEGYGVQLPEEYEIEGEKGKVIYVWFEAVCGYFTASVALSLKEGKLSQEDKDFFNIDEELEQYVREDDAVVKELYKGQSLNWRDYWVNNTKGIYFMGKDNIPFHTIIWPAILIAFNEATDLNLALPFDVPANQFLNLKGAKFSKSKGNVIEVKDLIDEFGVDVVRFFLISRMPENKDYDFTWEEFVEANNNELLANVGNLVNRVLVFWNKNYKWFSGQNNLETDLSESVANEIQRSLNQIAELIITSKFSKALEVVMKYSSFSNKYFNDSKIWEKVKDDSQMEESIQIMQDLVCLTANLGLLLRPFMPGFSEKIFKYLGVKEVELQVGTNHWQPIFLGLKNLGKIDNVKPIVKKLEPIEND